MTTRQPAQAPAHLIRLAMLLGVLLFGGTVWYLRRQGEAPGVGAEQAQALLWIGRALWGAAILGCAILFQLVQRATGARALSLRTVAWALGEMVALYGAVVWMQTGTPSWFMPGVIFLVLTFLAFPVRSS